MSSIGQFRAEGHGNNSVHFNQQKANILGNAIAGKSDEPGIFDTICKYGEKAVDFVSDCIGKVLDIDT